MGILAAKTTLRVIEGAQEGIVLHSIHFSRALAGTVPGNWSLQTFKEASHDSSVDGTALSALLMI